MNIEIDETTGLPALPENQYWEVEQDVLASYYGRTEYCVTLREVLRPDNWSRWTIRQKHVFVGSERLEEYQKRKGLVYVRSRRDKHVINFLGSKKLTPTFDEHEISAAAEEIIKERAERARQEERVARLVGKYPPKTIGV